MIKDILSENCVIYYAYIDDLKASESFKDSGKLPNVLKKRVLDYKTESAKILSENAWRLFMKLLQDTGKNRDIQFVFGENGKPYIKDNEFFFNISHSENMVAAAISKCEVGIDVEIISERNLKIADRFFNASEIDFIKNSENNFSDFTKLWTRKEAFLKATGKGLKIPLNSFSVLSDKVSEYKLSSFCIDNKYILSVATNGNIQILKEKIL